MVRDLAPPFEKTNQMSPCKYALAHFRPPGGPAPSEAMFRSSVPSIGFVDKDIFGRCPRVLLKTVYSSQSVVSTMFADAPGVQYSLACGMALFKLNPGIRFLFPQEPKRNGHRMRAIFSAVATLAQVSPPPSERVRLSSSEHSPQPPFTPTLRHWRAVTQGADLPRSRALGCSIASRHLALKQLLTKGLDMAA